MRQSGKYLAKRDFHRIPSPHTWWIILQDTERDAISAGEMNCSIENNTALGRRPKCLAACMLAALDS
jgi:hypothetical protein